MQALAACDRRIKARGATRGRRTATVVLILLAGLIFRAYGTFTFLSLIGCASALFGRRGAARPIVEKLKKTFGGGRPLNTGGKGYEGHFVDGRQGHGQEGPDRRGVGRGFARNYLIPRKMAKEATPEALNAISRAKSADKHREDVRRAEAEQRARELKGKVIQLTVRGGENGKLYGAVTTTRSPRRSRSSTASRSTSASLNWKSRCAAAGQTTVTLKLMAGISTRMLLNVKVAGK